MPKEERIVSSKEKTNDKALDLTLRPRTLNEYIGQERIKKNLKIFLSLREYYY